MLLYFFNLSKHLPTEKMGGNDLDMIQYYQLVGTCRVPNKNKDDIKIMHLKDINVKM